MQSLEADCEEAEVISTTIQSCQCDLKSFKANNMVCSHHNAFRPKLSKASRTALGPDNPVPIDIPVCFSPSTSYSKSSQVQGYHQSLQPSAHSAPLPFSIHAKLLELYEEECNIDPNKQNTGLKRNYHLLEKLMPRERLNTLIVTLYPGHKGYSISIPKPPSYGSSTNTGQTYNVAIDDNTAEDTVEWLYEENVFQTYINKQELPAFLIDLLKRHCSFLFYTGCIIAEVRDYRQDYPGSKCDIHHVLLRPTNQSILADVRGLSKGESWTAEDKLQMESQIYLANYPKLCLDPNSSISKTSHTITSNKQILDTHSLRHSASKHSISFVKQKRKLEKFTSRPDLQLYSFVSNMRAGKTTTTASLSSPPCKIPRKSLLLSSACGISTSSSTSGSTASTDDPLRMSVSVPNLDAPHALAPPTVPTLITQFKAHTRLPDTSDCSPQLVETYVLETDIPTRTTDKAGPSTSTASGKRVYHIRLSILQRPSNGEYLGELYLDRDHKEGETNGVACKFSLGTSAHANRYIQQFTEIVTESGRKPIRINYGPAPELKEKVLQMIKQMPQQHQQQLAQLQLQQQHLQQQLQQQLLQNTQAKALSQQSTKELEINAIAAQLMTDTQQFQAAAFAKQQQLNREKQLQQAQQQQQQQQQQSSNNISNNIAICNILNAPVISTSINAAAATAAVTTPDRGNTTTMLVNHQLTPQQKTALNHKIINRKFTLQSLAGVPVTRNILVNNNHYNHHHHHRLNLSDLKVAAAATAATGQHQTITLANFTSIPIVPVQPQPQSSQQQSTVARVPVMGSGDGGKSALSAMLDGTPSADWPDLMQSTSSSLLLEKFNAVAAAAAAASNQTTSGTSASPTGATHFIHSPKSILSPLSSPPPTSTISTPSLLSSTTPPASTITHHFTTQQISAEQQQQQQLQLQAAFSQGPISLLSTAATGSAGGGGGVGGGSLLVSMPVTSTAGVGGTGREQQIVSLATTSGSGSLGATTVVFANVGGNNIAQLVTSGIKGLTAQNLRAAAAAAAAASSVSGSTAVTLTTSTVNNTTTGTIQAGGMATFQLLTASSAAATAAATALQQQQRITVGQARLQPAPLGGHHLVGITPNVQGVSGGRATIQRGTPITIKMATATPGTSGVTSPTAPNASQQQPQVVQLQQYQQLYVNEPKASTILGNNDKLRRRPNLSEQQ